MPLLYGDSGHHCFLEKVQGLRKRCFENVGDSSFKFKTLNIWTILRVKTQRNEFWSIAAMVITSSPTPFSSDRSLSRTLVHCSFELDDDGDVSPVNKF